MKIAILVSGAGYIHRGVESAAYELYRNLPGEVKVFGLGEADWVTKVWGIKRTSLTNKIYWLPAKHLHLYLLGRFFPFSFGQFDLEILSYILAIRKPLREFDPDVIINLVGPLMGKYCRAYRNQMGTPYITVNGGGSELNYIILKQKPDAYVVVTPEMEKSAKLRSKGIPVRLIPNGVNLKYFSPNGQKMTFDELKTFTRNENAIIEHPIILSTSALDGFKRLDLLIKAVKKMREGTLIFTGGGHIKDELLKLGKEELGDRFLYIGIIPYEKLPLLYRTCDVFSLPSVHEPFGIVLLEAMASGLPVVSTNDANRRWIVGENGGILLDVTDIDEFARALENAYETDFGEGPSNQAKQFSWEVVSKKYDELIKELLECKNE